MIDVVFEINGKRVNPNDLGNVLERAVLESAKKAIIERVGSVRCPQHGQAAKIIYKGHSLDKLSFEVEGCCEALIGTVKYKLG